MNSGLKKITSIDSYIAKAPLSVRPTLKKLREVVRLSAPKATEEIKYGMPTFVLGKNLVHFAVMKNHIGFYPAPSAIIAFNKELSAFKTSKGAIQFPLNKPVPFNLIQKIVKFRVKENSSFLLKKKPSKVA